MWKAAALRFRAKTLAPITSLLERSLVLQGAQASLALRSLNTLNHLSDAEFRVYSQWGEDGIIEWLIQRLPIRSERFVEFGVETYREANTRFLMVNRNWRGLIIDGDPESMRSVREDELYWRHSLTEVCAFIDRDNINDLISKAGFSGGVGILSIDVDGNDYWIWEAIDVIEADIVICEYNAVFGDLRPLSVPYSATFLRSTAHSSSLYFGASVAALRSLGEKKGYELIGSNRAGNNAFFVRKELYSLLKGEIEDRTPRTSKFRESRDGMSNLNFLDGLDRFNQIRDMPVVNVDSGATVPLGTLEPVYSAEWLSDLS